MSREAIAAPIEQSMPPNIPGEILMQRSEQGGVPRFIAMGIGAATLATIALLSGPAGSFLGSIQPKARAGIIAEKSKLEPKHIFTGLTEAACPELSAFDLQGNYVTYAAPIANHNIPGLDSKVIFVDHAKVGFIACGKTTETVAPGTDEKNIAIETTSKQSTDPNNPYDETEVNLRADKLFGQAYYVDGAPTVKREDGGLLSFLTARSNDGATLINVGCQPFRLKVHDLDCNHVAANAANYVNGFQTAAQTLAAQAGLEAVSDQSMKDIWKSYAMPAFLDEIARNALQNREGDAEQILAHLDIKITGEPDFTRDLIDMTAPDLKKGAAAYKAAGIKQGGKIKVKTLVSGNYTPKYYGTFIQNPDGTISLTPAPATASATPTSTGGTG